MEIKITVRDRDGARGLYHAILSSAQQIATFLASDPTVQGDTPAIQADRAYWINYQADLYRVAEEIEQQITGTGRTTHKGA